MAKKDERVERRPGSFCGDELRIRVQRAPWYMGAELLIATPTHKMQNAVMVPIDKNLPTDFNDLFQIDDKCAQTLMDDLWASGYRPTEGAGTAGAMQATQKHLDDMRAIVGKQLEVEMKGVKL